MGARAKHGLRFVAVGAVTAALAALAGATLQQATSAPAERPKAIVSILKTRGEINGAIYAVQRTSELKARVSVSLHHLAPATSYVITPSTAGCSHSASTSSRVFRVAIKTTASRDDAFKATGTQLSKPVTKARSLRIYEQGTNGDYREASCGAVDDADLFQ
jgi:hypothetical protein